MHDEIIRYSLNGEITDDNIVKAKEELVFFVEGQMRDEGCVPSLDLEPQFTLDYNSEREVYNFVLTVYGIYVGGKEAWQETGVTTGKTIPKYIHQVKSSPS